nr:hypothetical protein [Tanacetum cinerariifolium]
MTSLADKAILSGAGNRLHMLEMDMYDSWKSRMELYMLNRQHGRMILELVEQDPLLCPTVEEDGVTRLKKYSKLSAAEAIQADCDVKAINIILQGLPPEVYALGETLRDYYLRFSLILNDMNMYNMKLEQFQVNTKFLNTLPPEWSKFVTDVKLVRDLHTTNVDQLHAYLSQHKYHANEIDYAPIAQNPLEFSSPETGLVVSVFQKGDDPIDAINHMMSFLTAVATSRPFASGSGGASGKQRVIVCYNCKGEGHMSKQCTKPKRKRDAANGQVLQEEELEFLADPGMTESSSNQTVVTTNVAYQAELALEKQVKELNNIVFKRSQSAQTLHMLTKPQVFYNHSTRQALGFQNPCYLKKAQQLKPKLYDRSVIEKSDAIVIPYTEETLILDEGSHSKMIEKQNDPQITKKKVITKPINYAIINQLSTDFETRFVPQTELSEEQAFWSQYLVQTDEPNLSATTTIVEVLKELPKVSIVNSCLKKLKFHLASFDMVVKERTTAITEGMWGFEHSKACFRDDIIPFVKAIKELFTSFDQCLIDEVTEVQNVFMKMEMGVEQHHEEKHKFQNKVENVLQENDRLLTQALSVEIMNAVVNDNVKSACLNMDVYAHCVTIESELKKNFVKKECYETNTVSSPKSAPTFAELFEINDLKAQAQAKDTVILKLKEKLHSLNGDVNERKVKSEVEEIETLNIELDHKSAEVFDFNASLQEKVLVITALKEQLNKLKGKAVLTKAISLNPIDPELLKVDVAPLVPKLCKNRTAHTDYIRHTQEEAATLREIVESERLLSPLNTSLDYACKYTRRIQELLMILQQTYHCLTDLGTKLVAVTPKNKTKHIRLIEQITKSGKTTVTTPPSAKLDSNTPVLSSTRVILVSSASGSMSKDNTKKNRIRRTHRKAKKNKIEDHLRTVKSSLNKKRKVFKTVGHIWKPTGRTFTLVGNVCHLTRIATTTIVPPKEPSPIVHNTDKPVVTLVYSRKPKVANKKVPSLVANKMEPNSSWGSSSSNVSSPLIDCRLSKSSSGTWVPAAQST